MSDTRLNCPHCQTALKLPRALPPGKKLKCPKCSNIFAVPDAPPEPVKTGGYAGAAAEDDVDNDVSEAPVRRRRRAEAENEYDDRDEDLRGREDDDLDDDDYDRPRRRRRRRRRRASRSGAVTSVGVVNLVLGTITLLCGIVVLLGASVIGLGGQAAARNAMANNPQGAQAAGGIAAMIGAFGAVIAVVMLVSAVLYILAGIGVLKRRQWGRILTLVLAGFMVLGAVFNVIGLAGGAPAQNVIIGLSIQAGYAALCFTVLLNGDNAAEFE